MSVREDVLLKIMDLVEACGTGFAFPSQTLYLARDQAPTPPPPLNPDSSVATA